MPFKSHISLAYALPLFVLRIVEIVFAICVLGLLAYLAYYYNLELGSYTSVESGALGVGIFTACITILANTYYLVAALAVHKIYHPIAVLALESFLVLFWLITFALCAKSTADFHAYDNGYSGSSGSSDVTYYTYNGHTYECFSDGSCYAISKRATSSGTSIWTAIFSAALALSIIEWFMFIGSLVLIAIGYHRTRRSGAPAVAAAPATADEKVGAPAVEQPAYGQTYDQQYAQPQYTQPTHYTEGSELPQQQQYTQIPQQQQYTQPHEYNQTYAQPTAGQYTEAAPQQTYTHPAPAQ